MRLVTVFWVERWSVERRRHHPRRAERWTGYARDAILLLISSAIWVGCALITDGRFSGEYFRISIGHVSPEAAAGGNIGKIKDGDIIEIDIPNRSINVKLTDEELAARPMTPVTRNREVSKALKAYASMVSSADKGAVRLID